MSSKYLLVKGCAGLGNRLVTIFSAIKYCEKNNRILVVDWTDGQFDKKGVNAFHKCFDLNNILYTNRSNIDNWDNLNHSSQLFKNNKEEGLYDLYVDKQSAFWQKIPNKLFVNSFLKKLRRRWQPIKNGNYLTSLGYGSDLPNDKEETILYFLDFIPYIDYTELPNYIQPKPFISEKIDKFSIQNKIDEAVGVHIRYTDKRPTTEVKKIIEYIKLNHKSSAVYLATDSTEIEKLFLDEFPNLLLFPKCKPQLHGEGLHQWALYSKEEDLKYVLFEESIIELFLLSKCQYLYYQGNSTFSIISKTYHTIKTNTYDWLKL